MTQVTKSLMTLPLAVAEGYRQARAVRSTHETSGLPILKRSDLVGEKTHLPGTLFILGSGQSVLATSRDQWRLVSRVSSIGIGAWTIHPFVPTFLALEHIAKIPERDGVANGETGLERSYREALKDWHARKEVQQRQPRILFFRPPVVSDLSRLYPLGDYWQSRTYLYGRVGPISADLRGLRSNLWAYLNLAKAGIVPFHLPFDTGATLVRIVLLGALAGYRKIVLNGVDLRDSRFFWEVEPQMLRNSGMSSFYTPENGALHTTETRRFPVSQVLPILSSELMKVFGTRLLVAHRESWVSSILPVFDWSALASEERR